MTNIELKEAMEALVTTLLQGGGIPEGEIHRAFVAAYVMIKNEEINADSGERLAQRILDLLGFSEKSTDKRIVFPRTHLLR